MGTGIGMGKKKKIYGEGMGSEEGKGKLNSDGANGGGNAEGHPPAAPTFTSVVLQERAESVRKLNR